MAGIRETRPTRQPQAELVSTRRQARTLPNTSSAAVRNGTSAELARAVRCEAREAFAHAQDLDPRVEALVTEVIGRVADKWTMIIIDVLAEHGELRFTQVAKHVSGISQKMLTQTLRAMERDGLVIRTVHPVVPPRVEYRLTDLGFSLGAAFCSVWMWAEANIDAIEQARTAFDQRARAMPPSPV